MKTAVAAMSPAEKLAAHDQAARIANANLPQVDPAAALAPKELTAVNLICVTLDVVKEFGRRGFSVSTLTADLAVDEVMKRFPNGVKLAPPAEHDVDVDPDFPSDALAEIEDNEREEAAEAPVAPTSTRHEDVGANSGPPESEKKAKPAKKKAPSRRPAGPSPK